MKLHKLAIGAFVLWMASWALAQRVNLTGAWKVKTVSPQGTSEQTITFQQTGNTFTGEMVNSQGAKEAIKGGKVTGEAIEFTIERQRPTGETASVPYKGKVNGDAITGSFTGATGREVQWTAERQK
jgi:hypothetical protein